MKTILTFIMTVCLLAVGADAQNITNLVPATRLPATGTYVGIAGVKGGIDQYSTNYAQFCNVKVSIPGTNIVAYGDGIHDDTVALKTALTLATNASVVYLPAGNYLITNTLSRVPGYDYAHQNTIQIILRGAGMGQTVILNNGAGEGIDLAQTLSFGDWAHQTNLLARGTTVFQLSSIPGVTPIVGEWLMAHRLNTNANVYLPPTTNWNVAWAQPPNTGRDSNVFYYVYEGSADQLVQVTNITGNNLNFWPPLNDGYGTNEFSIRQQYCFPYHCGIENLTVVQLQDGNFNNIRLIGGSECWIRNVESRQSRKAHISLEYCGGCEVRGCYLHEPFPYKDGNTAGGSSDYGIDVGYVSSSCLIEDNILLHCRHSIVLETGCGQDNVVTYNFGKDNINEGMFATSYQMDTDYHGGEPRYNLFEGNVVPIIRADAVEGATKYCIYFRNLVTRDGLPSVNVAMNALDIQRGNYYDYFLCNVYFACAASPSTAVYRLGSWEDQWPWDNAVYTNNVYLGNYDYATNKVDFSTNGAITWSNSIAASFPSSCVYTSKPAWYSNSLNWPPFGADLSPKTNFIPAQLRAANIAGFTNVVTDDYALTLTNTAGGTASAPGNQKYFNGAWVALTASPTGTNTFSYWSANVTLTNALTSWLVMPASAATVTAYFSQTVTTNAPAAASSGLFQFTGKIKF